MNSLTPHLAGAQPGLSAPHARPPAPRPSDIAFRYTALAVHEQWRCACRGCGRGVVVGHIHLQGFVTAYEVELDGADGRRVRVLPSQVRPIPDVDVLSSPARGRLA